MHSSPAILEQSFGYDAFCAGQEKLIDVQLACRDVFGIMPTGGGKSLHDQIPALLSEGITLVELQTVSDAGAYKAARYGARFLVEIAREED